MIETLLGIDPAVLREGTLVLGAPVWLVAAGAATGCALVALALGYRSLAPGGRALLAGLRAALVVLLVLALARPALMVTEPAAGSGALAVVFDDSRSMALADVAGRPRGEAAHAALGAGSDAGAALEGRFRVHRTTLSGADAPLDRPVEADAAYTDLAAALDRARRGLGGATPAGIVLVSDGADASEPGRLARALLALRAARIPVYAVGVGGTPSPDIEVRIAALAERALAGDVVEAVIEVRHAGLAGEQVTVRLEDEGAIVAEVPVTLPGEGASARATARMQLDEAGARLVRASVAPLEDEPLTANNADLRAIEVTDRPARVLHFEGEPRFEVKFLRRALAGDARLEPVSLVRTAENKFYRLGVRSADELAEGFPTTAETLFAYDVLVLGSVEAALLTPQQQALVAQFVSRRGGGLIALGGRRALAEGGLGRAALAGVLPVVLGAPEDGFSAAVAMRPTPDGLSHPALEALAAGDWEQLPPLTVVNPVRAVKPGATVLLAAETEGAGSLVGLAVQRYGRGLVAALPVRDTWRWQLHPDVALEDVTHEQFWRQLLRWIAAPARRRLALEISPATPGPGEPVRIRIEALDAAFRPDPGALPALEIEEPTGERSRLPLTPDPAEPGVFGATLTPAMEGRHDLRVRLGEEALERARVEVLADGRELHGAGLDAALLERIARETGGAYLPLARVDELATLVAAPPGAERVTRRVPLGRSPLLLLALVALLCAEWLVRRRLRLA